MHQQEINILGIAPYRFLPAINGGHKAIDQLYSNLGVQTKTLVVSTKNNRETINQPYQLIRLFSNGILHYVNLFYFFSLRSLIRKHHITHVISEHPYMGWLGILLKKFTGVKFVVRSHNIEASRFQTLNKWWWKAMWHYEKWILSKADACFFITPEDREYAVNKYWLDERRCFITTFGTTLNKEPGFINKQKAKLMLQQQYHFPSSHKILLFNGSFSYQPNLDALYHLLNIINPLLLAQNIDNYQILICGIHLPESILQASFTNVSVAGFVDHVNDFFMGADIFVCPVVSGGGIKTKLIEALAYDNTCISYANSAIGIDANICNNKLLIAEDNNAEQFVMLIQQALHTNNHIDNAFYNKYSAYHIAQHLLKTLHHTLP